MKQRRLRRLLRLAFALALLVTLAFGIRALVSIWHFADRAERPVAAWMTPRYVVAVYGLDRDALATILNLPAGADPRESIGTLAFRAGRSPQQALAEIEALIHDQQLGQQVGE